MSKVNIIIVTVSLDQALKGITAIMRGNTQLLQSFAAKRSEQVNGIKDITALSQMHKVNGIKS